MLKKSIEVKLNAGCSLAGAGQLRLESELKVGKKQGQLKFADLRVSSITKCNSKSFFSTHNSYLKIGICVIFVFFYVIDVKECFEEIKLPLGFRSLGGLIDIPCFVFTLSERNNKIGASQNNMIMFC